MLVDCGSDAVTVCVCVCVCLSVGMYIPVVFMDRMKKGGRSKSNVLQWKMWGTLQMSKCCLCHVPKMLMTHIS